MKANGVTVAVYYFLQPAAQAKEAEKPHAFFLDASLLLGGRFMPLSSIKQRFFLKFAGRFHWRFRQTLSMGFTNRIVWMDLNDENALVPCENEVIVAKVLCLDRVCCYQEQKLALNAPYSPNILPRHQEQGTRESPTMSAQSSVRTSSSEKFTSFQSPTTSTVPKRRASAVPHKLKSSRTSPLEEYRKNLALEAIREEARSKQRSKLQNVVNNWRRDSTGQAKNLPGLLSSLDQILWESAKIQWTLNGLILGNDETIRYYKKALRIVHPDKVKEESNQVLAALIFEIINESYINFCKTN